MITFIPVRFEVMVGQLMKRFTGSWECKGLSCVFVYLGKDESQARIKIVRRNINILRYADDITLIAESKEELNSLLMKGKRRE